MVDATPKAPAVALLSISDTATKAITVTRLPVPDGRIEFSSVWVSIPTCPWQASDGTWGVGDAPVTP